MEHEDDMAEAAWERHLREFGEGDPTQDDIRAIEEEMFDGPDRGAALVLSAIVEKSLEHLIKTKMEPERLSGLFTFSGPVGSLSSKVQLAYSLGLIGQKTRYDLKIIRLVRNQFAHSRRPIEFTTEVVRDACKFLKLPDLPGVHLNFNMLNKVSNERLADASDKAHPRTRYFTSCNEIAQRIYFIRGAGEGDQINQLP